MDTCAKCGAELGVGRFCLNCGHRIGAPVTLPEVAHAQAQRAEQGPAPQPAIESRTAELPVTDVEPTSDSDVSWLPGSTVADDGPQRLNWGAWVLGALAVVAAALLALSFLSEDDSSATDRRSTPAVEEDRSGEDEDASRGARDVARDATVTVPTTAPPTTDLDGALVPYDATRMVDGRADTAWRMAGDGTGAEVTLTLAEPAVIDRVGLVNGYAKRIAGVDWYPNNRRILGVRWTFEDGTSVDQTFAERRRLQQMAIDPVETGTVTLTITAVTPPGTGEMGRDYTPISTVVLRGRPAG